VEHTAAVNPAASNGLRAHAPEEAAPTFASALAGTAAPQEMVSPAQPRAAAPQPPAAPHMMALAQPIQPTVREAPPAPPEDAFFDAGDEGTYEGGPRSTRPAIIEDELDEPSPPKVYRSTPAQQARVRRSTKVVASVVALAAIPLLVALWQNLRSGNASEETGASIDSQGGEAPAALAEPAAPAWPATARVGEQAPPEEPAPIEEPTAIEEPAAPVELASVESPPSPAAPPEPPASGAPRLAPTPRSGASASTLPKETRNAARPATAVPPKPARAAPRDVAVKPATADKPPASRVPRRGTPEKPPTASFPPVAGSP
jgi:hypothetical protein